MSYPLFGVGLGNYSEYFTKEITDLRFSTVNKNITSGSIQVYDDPHNVFFSFFAETGFFGLTTLLIILVFFSKQDLLIFFKKNKSQNDLLRIAFLLSFWSLILYSLINPANSMRFYFLLATSRIVADKLS